MFGLFKKREKKPTAVWFKWMAVGFVAYALISNLFIDKPKAPADTSVTAADDSLSPEKILQFDKYKDKLLPQAVPRLTAADIVAADGPPATCGQDATISYTAATQDEKPIESNKTTFRIGDGKAMPALEEGIVGMAKGGKRVITAPADTAYAKTFARADVPENTVVKFTVELLGLAPPLPEPGAYRILGNIDERGAIYHCGDAVKLNVALWSVEGKKLYESKEPISFTIGASEVFLGLEQGALGLSIGGVRHLVVPPDFQKTLRGNAPAMQFPLPKKQTVLVDIESVP